MIYVAGKGRVGEPEIILQSLFPEQLIHNQILDTSNLLLLRAKYLALFVEVSLCYSCHYNFLNYNYFITLIIFQLYLETEKITKDFSSLSQVWDLLSLAKSEIELFYLMTKKKEKEHPKYKFFSNLSLFLRRAFFPLTHDLES